MDHKNQRISIFTFKTRSEEGIVLFFNYTEKEYKESIELYTSINKSRHSIIDAIESYKDNHILFNEIDNSDGSDIIVFPIKEIMKKHVPTVYEQMKDGQLVKGKYEFHCKKKRRK